MHWVEQHKAAVLLGIGVALTIINGLQLGLDPLTDAAEGADLTALAGDTAASAEDAGADADTDVEVNCGESFTAPKLWPLGVASLTGLGWLVTRLAREMS